MCVCARACVCVSDAGDRTANYINPPPPPASHPSKQGRSLLIPGKPTPRFPWGAPHRRHVPSLPLPHSSAEQTEDPWHSLAGGLLPSLPPPSRWRRMWSTCLVLTLKTRYWQPPPRPPGRKPVGGWEGEQQRSLPLRRRGDLTGPRPRGGSPQRAGSRFTELSLVLPSPADPKCLLQPGSRHIRLSLLWGLPPLSTVVKGKQVMGMGKERSGYFQSKGDLYPLKQVRKFLFYAPVKPMVPFSVTGGFLGRISAALPALQRTNLLKPQSLFPLHLAGTGPWAVQTHGSKGTAWRTEWRRGPVRCAHLGQGWKSGLGRKREMQIVKRGKGTAAGGRKQSALLRRKQSKRQEGKWRE